MSTTPTPKAVTVQHDFWSATSGGDKLFSVRGGINLTDAFNELSFLLCSVKAVMEVAGEASDIENNDACRAASQMVDFVSGLCEAMHGGLIDHEESAGEV